MSEKHRSTEYDKKGVHNTKVDVFCSCGGTTESFAPDLVSCTVCHRDYLIVRRANKAQLWPVKPFEEDDDGWESEVERALSESP